MLLTNLGAHASEDVPAIAAASDLKFVLEAVIQRYTAQTGQNVKVSFGSSGQFFRQISQGAPFELFLSADEQYVFELEKKGLTVEPSVLYAIGRLVFFTPHDSLLHPDTELKGLTKAVLSGGLTRLAIANPEHAPYGRAAKQALLSLSLWDKVQDKLVLGENVAQAAQFAASGAADGGIFAYSLMFTPSLQQKGDYVILSPKLYAPLRQRMALLKNAGTGARAFFQYLQHPDSRAFFPQYGFDTP